MEQERKVSKLKYTDYEKRFKTRKHNASKLFYGRNKILTYIMNASTFSRMKLAIPEGIPSKILMNFNIPIYLIMDDQRVLVEKWILTGNPNS